jgi:hypothetical protein
MSKTVGSTPTQYVCSGQDLIEERDGTGVVLSRYVTRFRDAALRYFANYTAVKF